MLHNQLQKNTSTILPTGEPGITSGGEDLLSNLNFGEEASAFNQCILARNYSNHPSFLDGTASDIGASGTEGQGGEFDLDEIENILGTNFGRIQEAMQELSGELPMGNEVISAI